MKKRRWLRVLMWTAAALVVLVALAVGLYEVSGLRTFQLFGKIVSRIETQDKLVALTFDDGPSDRTDEILGILDDAGVKATFFLNGNCMEEFPDETRQIVETGHQIGNHTFSHVRMLFLPPSRIADEIERTDNLIRAAGFEGDIRFRPPHGKKLVLLPYYLQQRGMTTVMWDLEPNSFPEVDASAEGISRYVVDNAKPGSIILLHVMYDKKGHSLDAIPGIVSGLKEKGYSFVTVNELMSYNSQ